MNIKTTRDKLIDGDVYYFVQDPQYVHELYINASGEKFDYVIGSDTSIPFEQVMAAFVDVVVIHSTRDDRGQ